MEIVEKNELGKFIKRHEIFSIPFYKKTHFTGSYKGMRYYIEKYNQPGEIPENAPEDFEPENGPDEFRATVFPEPYSYDNTSEDVKIRERFPFSDDGLDQVCLWLNEQYETREELWLSSPNY